MSSLIYFLDAYNELVQLFRTTRDKCRELDIPEFKIRLYNGEGARGYEFPTSNTLGTMVFESGITSNTDFDVIIQHKDGPPQRVNKLHPSYMSLQFPLLFIYRKSRYHTDLMIKSADGHGRARRIIMLAYYIYQLHFRLQQYDLLFRDGSLFQQYIWSQKDEDEERDVRRILLIYADGRDNYDSESSDDDDDDDDVEKDEVDKEEEEHLALVDPSAVHTDDPFAAALPSSSPPPDNVKSLKDNIREMMTTINQRMSVEEIKRVVAQRVANAIEAIAIYKMKTNIARKSMIRTERQEDKVAENAINKKKWEGRALYSAEIARRHYKSECPIVKFQKCVDMIHGGVRASKPKTMQDAIEFATKLMDKKISTPAKRQAENKRKLDNTSKNNQNQQQPNKRQNTGRAYAAGHGEKKHYGGSKPLCSKCNYHHDGPCAPKCHKCNRVDHLDCDCRSFTNTNTANNQRGTGASQKATCCECGNQGHYRNDCPERKNQNHEKQTGGTGSRRVVHAFRGGETEQDLNNIEDKIEA
ncbi:putative reverse transcriptase domain, ribonuclease H-like domain, aspartic peptidase domain protein [Tanacetum coccineum]